MIMSCDILMTKFVIHGSTSHSCLCGGTCTYVSTFVKARSLDALFGISFVAVVKVIMLKLQGTSNIL